jgi:hypothetical protein
MVPEKRKNSGGTKGKQHTEPQKEEKTSAAGPTRADKMVAHHASSQNDLEQATDIVS